MRLVFDISSVMIVAENVMTAQRTIELAFRFGRDNDLTGIGGPDKSDFQAAQEILDNGEGLLFDELKTLDTLAKKIRDKRAKNGSIEQQFSCSDFSPMHNMYCSASHRVNFSNRRFFFSFACLCLVTNKDWKRETSLQRSFFSPHLIPFF